MKTLTLAFLATFLSLPAFAKGPMLSGTYVGEATTDKGGKLTLQLVVVNAPGTITRIAKCELEYEGQVSPCGQHQYEPSYVTMSCAGPGKRSCTYDRFLVPTGIELVNDSELGDQHWESHFSVFTYDGNLSPLLTIHALGQNDPEIEVKAFLKTYKLVRSNQR